MESRLEHQPENTLITMQLGLALTFLLGLMFISGGMFYLYTFNYDIGPYFTATRVIHFYAGLASIPFLLAKYASTGFRFAGYYLRLPRFKERGPPLLLARVLSPLLALDFFVLYFSGLYMLFHYYYSVTNVPPFDLKPVQLHLWASILAVPLLAAHLGIHLTETIEALAARKRDAGRALHATAMPVGLTRRAFLATVLAGGFGLAVGFQNTRLQNAELGGLFIGRIPREERGGPGNFPVETLFGKEDVDISTWRLAIGGSVQRQISLSYDELLRLPAVTERIRINCVSGWSAVPEWSGPRVRDVMALAGFDAAAKSVNFHSVSKYIFAWHLDPLQGDKALLATHVNGAPLSTNHGFPVRLIVPGYPGQNMVKQIDEITVRLDKEPFSPDFKLI
jgi:DMSO/TMAO reductase YedYZ molybdopterin-dependent catalytic subunit